MRGRGSHAHAEWNCSAAADADGLFKNTHDDKKGVRPTGSPPVTGHTLAEAFTHSNCG